MSNPIFRLANLDDLSQLIELRILMQREVHNMGEGDLDPGYADKVRDYLSKNLGGDYGSAVAEVGGKLVSANGIIIYHKLPNLDGDTGRAGYISNVYTLPEWRGRGIACELMKVIVEYARVKGVAKLNLGATEQGKGVYQRVGFTVPRFTSMELKLFPVG